MDIAFYPVGGYATVIAAMAVLLLLLLAVRPPRNKMTRPRALALAGLRSAALVLVLLAMLRPTVVSTEIRKQAATVVVLMDRSRSMQVTDAFGSKSRWQALLDALAAAKEPLQALANELEVRGYWFADEIEPVELLDADFAREAKADGSETAIGAALDEVLRREAGKRLAAVVLLSDGAQRAVPPRDESPQLAAQRLGDLGVPLYAFAFGQSRGLGDARDIAIQNVLTNPTVFVKNRLTVSGEVEAYGFAGEEVSVQLRFETGDGRMEVVDTARVEITGQAKRQRVELEHVPQQPGEYKVSLRAVERPGELVTTNNEVSTFVTVLKGGLNVLYLEGAVRLEQKFLRRSLGRSADIRIDYLYLDAQHPESRPADLAERFEPGRYDVYMIGDLDSSALSDRELELLAAAVRQGAGLIMLGGFHSFGPGGYQATPLGDLLPIEMDLLERQNFDEPISEDLHLQGPQPMVPTAVGERHFVTRLDDKANRRLWQRLPPLEGANRFRGLKPRAQVLAATPDGRPLLVAHDVGRGRVMAFAGDSTWRWWMQGFADAHRRFWRQVILWLAHKDDQGEGAVWVRLPRRRFRPGEMVDFTVGAETAAGEAVIDASFEVEVVLPDGSRAPVRLLREEGHFRGAFRQANQVGDYRIVARGRRADESLGQAAARFLVYEQELEFENPAADPTLLDSLARESGGERLPPEQLADLIDRLTEDAERFEIELRSKTTLWDKWPLMLAMIGVLSVEWWLRKRWGLV